MSYTWKSQTCKMSAKWKRIEENMHRMRFDRSPAIPHSLESYIKHVAEMTQEQAEYEARKLAAAKLDHQIAKRLKQKPTTLFDSQELGDPQCGVLGEKTIWADRWQGEPGHPLVRWPDPQEFKEEGDERHTSSFRRFMPLLRLPGNETVNWKHRPRLRQYPFDEVMPVPRLCPVVIPGLYGFHMELDANGLPYDDDNTPGGSIAIAFHLDPDGENLENIDEKKMFQYQRFCRKFRRDIGVCTDIVPYVGPDKEAEEEEDIPQYAPMQFIENTRLEADAKKDKHKGKKAFSFNPKASEFVSVIDTPSSSEEASPVEGPSESHRPMDVFAAINLLSAYAANLYAQRARAKEEAAQQANISNGDTAASPASTRGQSAPDYDELNYEDPKNVIDWYAPRPEVKRKRTCSFGAIGSERRSSGTSAVVLTEDDSDVETEAEGGVSLGYTQLNTIIPHRGSDNISPKTIPSGLAEHVAESDADDDNGNPGTLSELVAASEADYTI